MNWSVTTQPNQFWSVFQEIFVFKLFPVVIVVSFFIIFLSRISKEQTEKKDYLSNNIILFIIINFTIIYIVVSITIIINIMQ